MKEIEWERNEFKYLFTIIRHGLEHMRLTMALPIFHGNIKTHSHDCSRMPGPT